METIITMFATFVGFVTGVLFITEMVNKMFKIENTNVRMVVSWVMSFGLAALGLWMQTPLEVCTLRVPSEAPHFFSAARFALPSLSNSEKMICSTRQISFMS